MNEITDFVTQFFSTLTVIGQIFIALFIILYFFSRSHFTKLQKKISPHAFKLAFIVALTSTVGSLYYSEVAGFAPCILCWYQRIFIYPQVILLGLSIHRHETVIKPYSMALAAIGGAISAIHYYEQVTYNPLIPCETVGYSVSCVERFFMTFGYITIPLMALTASLLILTLLSQVKTKS